MPLNLQTSSIVREGPITTLKDRDMKKLAESTLLSNCSVKGTGTKKPPSSLVGSIFVAAKVALTFTTSLYKSGGGVAFDLQGNRTPINSFKTDRRGTDDD